MTGKIFHISYSSSGGAGLIARYLSSEQRKLGYESHLLTVSNDSVSQRPFEHPIVTFAALLDQFILGARGAELMSVYRNQVGALDLRQVGVDDIIHLHWVAGAVSNSTLNRLIESNRKIIWTLHDYRPLTGGCHYTQGCHGYRTTCGSCPQVRPFARKLVAENYGKSRNQLQNSNVIFVAPSLKLAEAASNSHSLAGVRIEYIPNPIQRGVSDPPSSRYGDSAEIKNFLFVAANVDDPRKGLSNALAWWKTVRKKEQWLTLIGLHSEKHTDTSSGILGLGYLPAEAISSYMASAEVLIFSSEDDNAPGVIAEAILAGMLILVLETRMIHWLKEEGTPIITSELLMSKAELRKYIKEVYSYERKNYLENRDTKVVIAKYKALYES